MSLNQTNIECLVIRRSENTNSFGLRGIWVLCLQSRDVFSFAANHLEAERYQKGAIVRVPFRLNVQARTKSVAHELSEFKGRILPAQLDAFLQAFDDSFLKTYNEYFKARAIEAETAPVKA